MQATLIINQNNNSTGNSQMTKFFIFKKILVKMLIGTNKQKYLSLTNIFSEKERSKNSNMEHEQVNKLYLYYIYLGLE